jgi:cobalamin biosynthesis protein CobW
VISKADLVEPAALADTRAWLRGVAGPSTSIVDAAFGDVPTDVLIGAREALAAGERLEHDHDHEGHEHPRYETWSWTGDAPLSGAGLVEALPALPDGIVRAKGLLHLREDPARRYLLQLVGRRYTIEAQRPWGDAPPRSRVVVIGLPGSVDGQALDATMARLSAPSVGR